MTTADFDFAEPKRNGSLGTKFTTTAPRNPARSSISGNGYAAEAQQNYRTAAGDGESEYVVADHLEYWHKLQPPATVADASVSAQRGTAGGELQGSGGDGTDKGFRRSPVAWGVFGLAVAILFGHIMIQIGAATSGKSDPFANPQSVWSGCEISKGRIDCR